MKYKYELHCHTKEVSRCSQVPVKETIQMYKDAGYSGIVITDHYSPMTFPLKSLFCPQKDADYYLKGYREAKKYETDDFTVLLGMELRYYATINDYLVYGITEDFIKNSGNLMKLYPKKFYELAKKNNLIVLQAHPFRDLIKRINPELLDGAEVYNGKATPEQNKLSLEWFNKEKMQIKVSGSDFHRPQQFAKGGIITNEQIKTNDDLLRILNSGDYELIGE